jgi:hypothetical protein
VLWDESTLTPLAIETQIRSLLNVAGREDDVRTLRDALKRARDSGVDKSVVEMVRRAVGNVKTVQSKQPAVDLLAKSIEERKVRRFRSQVL